MDFTHELDDRGYLKSLRWGDREFISTENGIGSLWGVRFRRPTGETYAGAVDAITVKKNWTIAGTLARCDITITNPTADVLESFYFDLMNFQVGTGDPEVGLHSHYACGFDQPNGVVLRVPGTPNYLAIYETQQNPNACFGIASYTKTPERNSWLVRIALRDEGQLALQYDVSTNEISAGGSMTFVVCFEVCATRKDAAKFARDWAAKNPPVAKRIDFDLGMNFLCPRGDMGKEDGPNPNSFGGKQFDRIDINTPNGLKTLRADVHDLADQCVFYAKQAGLGGIITWDVEGIGYDKYVGNPSLTFALAPEMRDILADYFAILKSAGLRTGVCIRPGYLVPVGHRWERKRHEGADAQETAMLRMNMEWARDAWGCDLFYLDSNNTRYSAVQMRDLQKGCPWAIVLAENGIDAAYGSSPRYIDSRQWPKGYQVPWLAKEMYPDAQAVACVFDETPNEQIEAIWRQGSYVITNAWYRSNVLFRMGRLKEQRKR